MLHVYLYIKINRLPVYYSLQQIVSNFPYLLIQLEKVNTSCETGLYRYVCLCVFDCLFILCYVWFVYLCVCRPIFPIRLLLFSS